MRMRRVLKTKDKMKIFLGGMSKAFDWRNTKSLYRKKRSFPSVMLYGKQKTIMGPLSRPRSKILRVAVSRIILSSEASKVKLVGNLVA